jgi:ABC-type glycerol-3-phosphate transport system substrate-binding protein
MKLFAALALMALLLVACGGSDPVNANGAQAKPNDSKVTFDAPPSPGAKN